jgi:hypothetical protein
LGFIRFEDRPHLLSSNENRDDGLPWEVHPSYRSVLRIKGTPESRLRNRSVSRGHARRPFRRAHPPKDGGLRRD